MKNLFLVAASLAFASCETIVNIDLPEHKRALVVNSLFAHDSVLTVEVSHSIGSLDNSQINFVDNATVEIYKDGNYVGTLPSIGDGKYASSGVVARHGSSYTVKASAPAYDPVSSTTKVPVPVAVTSWSLKDSAVSIYGSYMAELSLTFNDPPGERNFYMLELYVVDSMGNSYREGIFPKTEESTTEQAVYPFILINDELINGKTYTVNALMESYLVFMVTPPNGTGNLVARFKSISSDFYLYLKTRDLQAMNGGNPFSEPVRVYSNIDGGYGIFAGSSATSVTIK